MQTFAAPFLCYSDITRFTASGVAFRKEARISVWTIRCEDRQRRLPVDVPHPSHFPSYVFKIILNDAQSIYP
jgi:hypothetical protein